MTNFKRDNSHIYENKNYIYTRVNLEQHHFLT